MGNRVKEFREKLGLSQEQLSDKSGVSRVSISLIESGGTKNPSAKTLYALASAMGTTVDHIFFTDAVN
jgi:putative transcriptional regulator